MQIIMYTAAIRMIPGHPWKRWLLQQLKKGVLEMLVLEIICQEETYGYELMNKLKDEAKVGLNSGATYGEEGVGFARLNIGCPKAMVEQALNQIKAAFDK